MSANPTFQIPPPPIGRWERLVPAANRAGLTPDLLRSELSTGRCLIRTARVGKRNMVLLASADVDRFAQRLAAGEFAA
jgi:hypothetical protein